MNSRTGIIALASAILLIAFACGCRTPTDVSEAQRGQVISIPQLQRAAARGNANAQFLLGLEYGRGTRVERDERAAVHWWLKSAETGHVLAQYQLGWAYAAGHGVAQDVEAYKWCSLALEQGVDRSRTMLNLVSRQMDDDMVTEGKRRVESFHQESNHAPATVEREPADEKHAASEK